MRELLFSPAALCLVMATGTTSMADVSEESSIHHTYLAWGEATDDKDIEKWSTFLADEPYFAPADSRPLTSTDEVIAYYERAFTDPLFSLDCKQEYVEVSESAKMAWSRGKCNFTYTGAEEERASGTSRWLKVWIKQSDGAWRCRVNSWRVVDQL